MQVPALQLLTLQAPGGPAGAIPGGFSELLAALGLGSAAATAPVAGPAPAVKALPGQARPAAAAKSPPEDAAPAPGDLPAAAGGSMPLMAIPTAVPTAGPDATTPPTTAVAAPAPAGKAAASLPSPGTPVARVPAPQAQVTAAAPLAEAGEAVAEGGAETAGALAASDALAVADIEPAPKREAAMAAPVETGIASAGTAAPQPATGQPPVAGGQARRSRPVDRMAVEGSLDIRPAQAGGAAAAPPKVERTLAAKTPAMAAAEAPDMPADSLAPVPAVGRAADAALPAPAADQAPAAAHPADTPAPAAMPSPASYVVTPPAAQVAVHLSRQLSGGETLVVSLSPEELGEVEIEIELDDKGHARAHIAAELPSTLELIQRDASVLEQALESAGLELAPEALTFDLRREGQASQQRRDTPRGSWTATGRSADPEPIPLPTARASRLLDLRV